MDFKDNFNRICREQGTTPTALLKAHGIATNKVTAWNNGSLPKEEMLVNLAKWLECSVMDFFADEDDLENQLSADEKDILRVFRSLDRRMKHEFMSEVFEYEKCAARQGDSANAV